MPPLSPGAACEQQSGLYWRGDRQCCPGLVSLRRLVGQPGRAPRVGRESLWGTADRLPAESGVAGVGVGWSGGMPPGGGVGLGRVRRSASPCFRLKLRPQFPLLFVPAVWISLLPLTSSLSA